MDAAGRQAGKAPAVIGDQPVPVRTGEFDLLAHRQALDHRPSQAEGFDISLEVADRIYGPDLPDWDIMKGGYDTLHPDLPKHIKGDPVLAAEPAPGLLHSPILL